MAIDSSRRGTATDPVRTTTLGASTFRDLADVSVTGVPTLLSAANTSRIALSGTNNHATVAVRVGGSTVSLTSGQRVAAGAAFQVQTQAAVYAFSEGAAVTVSLSEEVV